MRKNIKSVKGFEISDYNDEKKGENSMVFPVDDSFASLIQKVGYIFAAFSTQLNAIVDKILHPEIPYFDFEHIIVGGVLFTGIALATFLFSNLVKSKENQEQNIKNSLDTLLKTASPKVGYEFLDTLTEQLSKIFKTRYAFISEVHDNNVVVTVSVICAGAHQENFSFDLKNTPCESIEESENQFIERNAKNIYPKDNWLQEEGIESYFANPIIDNSGNIIGYIGVMHDDFLEKNDYLESLLETYSKRAGNEMESMKVEKALAESEEKFRTIFESAEDGIILANPKTKKFHSCNNKMLEMLGYTAEEFSKLGVLDVHPKEDLPYVLERFENQVRDESNIVRDIPFQRKDKSVFYTEINNFKITIEGETFITGIIRDIH